MGPSNQMYNEATTNNEPHQQYEHILRQLLQQQHLNLSGTNDPLRILSSLFPLFQLNTGQQSSPLVLVPFNTECNELSTSINNQSNTTRPTDSLAHIKIEYNSVKHKPVNSCETNDSAGKRVYLINKKKIIIGRKQKLVPADSASTGEPIVIDEANLIDEANPADIYIDNSSLVSRQHLSLQLKSCTGLSSSDDAQNKDTFWQMQSISKNGIFLNNHYIEKGKSIKLFLNKKYTMRFPNTNIKIYFETSASSEPSTSRLDGEFSFF